jgi:hypothetical protein
MEPAGVLSCQALRYLVFWRLHRPGLASPGRSYCRMRQATGHEVPAPWCFSGCALQSLRCGFLGVFPAALRLLSPIAVAPAAGYGRGGEVASRCY